MLSLTSSMATVTDWFPWKRHGVFPARRRQADGLQAVSHAIAGMEQANRDQQTSTQGQGDVQAARKRIVKLKSSAECRAAMRSLTALRCGARPGCPEVDFESC